MPALLAEPDLQSVTRSCDGGIIRYELTDAALVALVPGGGAPG